MRAVDQITGSGWTEEEVQEQAERYEIYVRKAAHMMEYAVFAVTVLLPLRGCGFRGRRLFLITALVCASFAAGDEWHQSFVGGRGPSADVYKRQDRESPVAIRSVSVGSMAGVSFENRKAQQTGREESTGIGLRNVAGMMHKMKGCLLYTS